MSKLYDIAKKRLAGMFGDLDLYGKTKLETDDIDGKTLTIIDFGFGAIDDKEFVCVLFKELPGTFYFGGLVLSGLMADIAADAESIEELKSTGIRLKFSKRKNKKGNREYTSIELVE